MATIQLSLSSKTDKISGKSEVMVRFFHGHHINQRARTNIFVSPDYWNNEHGCNNIPKTRLMNAEQKRVISELTEQNKRINDIKELISQSFIASGAGKTELPKDWLVNLMTSYNFPNQGTITSNGYFDRYNQYITTHKMSEHRKATTRATLRVFQRFDIYKGLDLTFESISPDVLRDFSDFLSDEHNLIGHDSDGNMTFANARYKNAFLSVPESREPQPRGENAIIDIMKRLRAFTNWAIDRGFTTNDPFNGYEIGTSIYGTPYYITNEERNQLYNTDLTDNPSLAVQRDIFVFQCLIGCRVSDLSRLTKQSVVGDMVEYIPVKTLNANGKIVRVPLNETAKEIVNRYANIPDNKLLPFISDQNYNQAIKKMFAIAGLTRKVLVLDSLTREQVWRPLNEVASSHLARRTFCGNLYKQVKDPNLIGKFSGHAEGSRAFARYRDIDDDMGRELVRLLDK